jgi:tetratricopeptide (TPR) repeat protein
MAKNETKKDTKKESKAIGRYIEAFLIKYRIVILSVIGALFLAAIVIGVFSAVTTGIHKKGLSAVDDISMTLVNAGEDGYAEAAEQALIDLEPLAQSKNIVGSRANMLRAEILFNDKDYAQAREAWLLAAGGRRKTYILPLALYNAAVCSEELSEPDLAVQYYEQASADETFVLKTHSLFNIGRVKDELGDYEGAATAYQHVVDAYAGDTWANIATTRLIALRSEGKIR